MILKSTSPEQTQRIAHSLAKKIKAGTLLCLYGNLGAGKTTFLKGFAKGLGVRSRVQSPTFTYERVHRGRTKFYHFDCYRISKHDPLLESQLREAIDREDGVIAIEWADHIAGCLPKKRLEVNFECHDDTNRTIHIRRL